MVLFCKGCNYHEDKWRFKEVFGEKTQSSKYYCPKCKKLIYTENLNKKTTQKKLI